jgi:hypothetical protein
MGEVPHAHDALPEITVVPPDESVEAAPEPTGGPSCIEWCRFYIVSRKMPRPSWQRPDLHLENLKTNQRRLSPGPIQVGFVIFSRLSQLAFSNRSVAARW